MFDFDLFDAEKPAIEQKAEIKIEDILVIEDDPEGVMECLNVHDLCGAVFYYATNKYDMLELLQSHCVDVILTDNPINKHIDSLLTILNFKCSIIIFDKDFLYEDSMGRHLERKGFILKAQSLCTGLNVYEFVKNYEDSFIDCFNNVLTKDITSLLLVNKLSYDSVMYVDTLEFLDMIFYSQKNMKSVLLPIPFDREQYVTEYLEQKEAVPVTTNITGNQFELF